MTTKNYYARPFLSNDHKSGFLFNSYDEFTELLLASKYKIFSITCNDNSLFELFDIFKIGQLNIKDWFDAKLENKTDLKKAKLFYLAKQGLDFKDAVNFIYSCNITKNNILNSATAYFNASNVDNNLPDHILPYIDYIKFANDCKSNGLMYEFNYNQQLWTCTNHNEF